MDTKMNFTEFQKKYYWHLTQFVVDCIKWNEGQRLAPYQSEILTAIATRKRVAAYGPLGFGKDTLMALAILWFALTREGRDWGIIITASKWGTLENFLWPEIYKWASRLKNGLWQSAHFDPLRGLHITGITGRTVNVLTSNVSTIEEVYTDNALYILADADTIPDMVFDIIEGTRLIETVHSQYKALMLAVATPKPNGEHGRFFDICSHSPGFDHWSVQSVEKEAMIASGLMSPFWVSERKRQWGERSAKYQNYVEGRFWEER